MSELGDKIRALCVPNALLCSAALDRAAELAEAHESALVAGVVKVKPLEWEAGDCDGWFAVDRIAGYVPHFTTEGGIASYEAARAARILSAIEPDLARLNALIAAAYEDAAQRAEDRGAATTADAIRARVPADAQAALDRMKREAVKEALSDFEKADWFWRELDPDDCGDTPDGAINRGMVGRFTVCHIRSSFKGPDRFCFIAPVLDPESDDEECLCFETEDEAIAAAKERRAILAAAGEEKQNG